ncbi:hypothetical protein BC829DRAFT_222268 [Chytridium lagenaria]|nr:hypothetical protein BC829DRAFT_222268 [Chytridium lagenaria]
MIKSSSTFKIPGLSHSSPTRSLSPFPIFPNTQDIFNFKPSTSVSPDSPHFQAASVFSSIGSHAMTGIWKFFDIHFPKTLTRRELQEFPTTLLRSL